MRTINRYIDEIKLKLARLEVVKEYGDEFIVSAFNSARKEIYKVVKGVFPERFSQIIQLNLNVNMLDPTLDAYYQILDNAQTLINHRVRCVRVPLPENFVDPYVVILRYTNGDNILNFECRQIDRRELNKTQGHSWIIPMTSNPVYFVQDEFLNELNTNYGLYNQTNAATTSMPKTLCLFGIETSYIGNLFTDEMEDIMIELWYVNALPDLESSTGNIEQEINFPPEFDELLITATMVNLLASSSEMESYQSALIEKEMQFKLMEEAFNMGKQKKATFLPSNEKEGRL